MENVREGERERSTEESDQLSRLTKKMKRIEDSNLNAATTDDMEIGSSSHVPLDEEPSRTTECLPPPSYRDTLQRNNPNIMFETRDNPIWVADDQAYGSGDDEPTEDDDPLCPTIRLTAAEKKLLRDPWRNALIIRMFDKGIGYGQLKRRLKTKWALKGDFSLIDIGCEYYVTRFTNMEDYDHVMLNGPWMIGDNYLVIRQWVPNFVPEEDHITKLTAWVRIPKLSVEYFNKQFLLHKIGQKIGRVLKVDNTTENVVRGQYTRMCVEVDLTKPLLSKFRLNGRVWGIQYEGLKMICFICGRQGHKEDTCAMACNEKSDDILHQNEVQQETVAKTDEIKERNYGNWMLVRKPTRRSTSRSIGQGARNRNQSGEANHPGSRRTVNRIEPAEPPMSNLEVARNTRPIQPAEGRGSRFQALSDLDPNLEIAYPRMEVEIEEVMGTEQARESNQVTNTCLVRREQMEVNNLRASRHGNRINQDKENYPSPALLAIGESGRGQTSRRAGRSGPMLEEMRSTTPELHRPNPPSPNNGPRRLNTEAQVANTHLERISHASDPDPMDLGNPPGPNVPTSSFRDIEANNSGQLRELHMGSQDVEYRPGATHGNMLLD